MKNLLQHFGICDKPLPSGDEPLQEHLRLSLVRMGGPNKIHWNIRIDEDQPSYPRSISASIWSMSAVGNE